MVVINDLASASRPATTISTQQQWEALRQQDCFGRKHVAGSPGMAVKQAARRKQRNGSTGSNLIQNSLGQQGFKIDIVHIQRRFEQVALHFASTSIFTNSLPYRFRLRGLNFFFEDTVLQSNYWSSTSRRQPATAAPAEGNNVRSINIG